jgi:arylsulfatase A
MAIDRRRFLGMLSAGAAALALGGAAATAGAAAKRPPNIVLFLIDDLGWADLGCYGSTYFDTPHIDRLCAAGMKFTDGYAAAAICSPTRAAVMTGRYPARLGITDWIRSKFQKGRTPDQPLPEHEDVGRDLLCPPNVNGLPLDELTIAEALKAAGYTTCHVGKWHLGTEGWWPENQGFDVNIGGCDFGQPPTYFDPYTNQSQGGIPGIPGRNPGEFLTDREAQEAVGFIRAQRDRPFFLHLAHYAVHTPIMGKKEVIEKYRQRPPTLQKNAAYAALVESVDDAVGTVVGALDELGLSDNTIIIFTSDNGGLAGPTSNSPLRSGKGYPYEGGIRVPVIVKWPGVVKAGSTSAVPVTSVDWLPTICEMAGARAPADRPIDGRSLMPLLRQSGPIGRDAIFWHFPHYRGNDVVPYSIIRSGDWKLIRRYEGRTFELFNLKDDLGEKADLAASRPDIVERLDANLTAWLRSTAARLPRPRA